MNRFLIGVAAYMLTVAPTASSLEEAVERMGGIPIPESPIAVAIAIAVVTCLLPMLSAVSRMVDPYHRQDF